MVYDRLGARNGASYGNIYSGFTSNGTVPTQWLTFLGVNTHNTERFLILKKWQFMLPALRTDDFGTISALMPFGDPYPTLCWYGRTVEGLITTFQPDPSPPALPINSSLTGSLMLTVCSEMDDNEEAWKISGIIRVRYVDD